MVFSSGVWTQLWPLLSLRTGNQCDPYKKVTVVTLSVFLAPIAASTDPSNWEFNKQRGLLLRKGLKGLMSEKWSWYHMHMLCYTARFDSLIIRFRSEGGESGSCSLVSHLCLPRSPFVNEWERSLRQWRCLRSGERGREERVVGNPMPSSPWPERYYRDLTRNPSPPLREILSSSYHSAIALLQLPAHYFITPWHLDPDHPFETSPQVWRSSYAGTLSYRTLPHPSSGKTNSALINGAIPNAYNLRVMYEERLAFGR